ncbi:hypothetical protein D3C78_1354440 [compost metagenome]
MRWFVAGQEFFRCFGFIRQLAAEIPDFEHFCVFKSVARVELDPVLESLTFSQRAIVIVQAHAPVSGLVSDVFVYFVAVGRGHGQVPVWPDNAPYEADWEKNVKTA